MHDPRDAALEQLIRLLARVIARETLAKAAERDMIPTHSTQPDASRPLRPLQQRSAAPDFDR